MKTPCAGAIILDNAHKHVLLISTKCRDDSQASHWGFPKGKRTKGESVHDCARREVLEETSIDIASLTITDVIVYEMSNSGKTQAMTYFVCISDSLLEAYPEDVEEIGCCEWVTIEEALTRLVPKRQVVLEEALMKLSIGK